MARKTNYAFKKNSRAKAKAAKREAKRQARIASKTAQSTDPLLDTDAEREDSSGAEQENVSS